MIGVSMRVIVWLVTESFKGNLDTWVEGHVGRDVFVASSIPIGKVIWRRIWTKHHRKVEWIPCGGLTLLASLASRCYHQA